MSAGRYAGKVVAISGSGRGIGFMLAHYFLDQGAVVVGFSRHGPTIQSEAYRHVTADVGDGASVRKGFARITKEFRSIDILINNAGTLESQYALILGERQAREMVSTNLLGVFFMSREAARIMRKAKTGRIITIGSMATALEPVGDSVYAASKAGAQVLTNILAKEFSTYNITCNTVAVTAIETDMLAQLPRQKIDAIIAQLPVPRMATVDDLTNVIDFLASDRSSQITAQTIFLGGVH